MLYIVSCQIILLLFHYQVTSSIRTTTLHDKTTDSKPGGTSTAVITHSNHVVTEPPDDIPTTKKSGTSTGISQTQTLLPPRHSTGHIQSTATSPSGNFASTKANGGASTRNPDSNNESSVGMTTPSGTLTSSSKGYSTSSGGDSVFFSTTKEFPVSTDNSSLNPPAISTVGQSATTTPGKQLSWLF